MNIRPCVFICVALTSIASVLSGSEPTAVGKPKSTVRPHPVAEARMTIGGREVALHSDRLGDFPMQLIASNSRVPVRVKLPRTDKEVPPVVGVMDGGRVLIDSGRSEPTPAKRGHQFVLDAKRQVYFVFEADAGEGIYRVFVAHASGRYTLEFWVGEKLPVTKTK